MRVRSQLEVSDRTYSSAAEITFYLLPMEHVRESQEVVVAVEDGEVRSHSGGGLLAPKLLAITSLSARSDGDVAMSLSLLARYCQRMHRFFTYSCRLLREARGHKVILLVNERSFDISGNAEEAARNTDRGEHALLDVTIDKSLLGDSNTITVIIIYVVLYPIGCHLI